MVTVVGRDESKIKRATCSSCASILEYYPSEVVTLWSGYDYESFEKQVRILTLSNKSFRAFRITPITVTTTVNINIGQ
jgi:hypothetical protein